MGMRILPCDDPVVAARRAKDREKQARAAARKRAQAKAETPRELGTVAFEPVTCPRCGDVFRGARPLHSYSVHRGSHCPWFDDAERAAHLAVVVERRNKLAAEHHRVLAQSERAKLGDIPPLHTGHELFERARAARRYWPSDRSVYAYPIYEDLLSEGVLALLENRDPAKAMRQFIRREWTQTLSLDAPAPGMDGLTLLDTLAA